jgi:glycosyltransferase involved in cell wall biosynthesis
MKLVFFNFTINYGGGPQYTVHLNKLLSRNHEVHVIDAYGSCLPYIEAIREAGVQTHILCPEEKKVFIGNKGIQRYINALRMLPQFYKLRNRLQDILGQIKPDAVWTINEKSLTFINICKTQRHMPVFLFVIGWSKAETVSRWLCYLMRKRTQGVVAVSKATMNELMKLKIPSSKLHLGLMTVEFEDILKLAQKPLDQQIPCNGYYPKILILAARPTYEKGLHVAYKAIEKLKKKGYNPALWITGAMPTGASNEYVRSLEKMACELDIKDNIFFLGWQSNFPAVIQACDMGILPSYTEGFPRVILEVMLLKKPVIATAVGGVEESVIDYKTGLITPVGDDKQLAEKIELLIQQPDLRESLVANASQHIHRYFSPDKHLETIESIFLKAKHISS